MKTREEIEQEYLKQMNGALKRYYTETDALAEKRKAALAELDDPMLRLIAAARRAVESHAAVAVGACRCSRCIELRDAIDYAEQRRAQG